jgi:hypothetical protein
VSENHNEGEENVKHRKLMAKMVHKKSQFMWEKHNSIQF